MTGLHFTTGILAVVVLVWLLFRSGGYRRRLLDAPPGGDWILTDERFIDPGSGKMVEVWSRPRTGERAYVRARSG